MREERVRQQGEVVAPILGAGDRLHQVAYVGQHSGLARVIQALHLGHRGMQSVGIVAVADRQQGRLSQRQSLPALLIQAVVLLSRRNGNDGVVAVIAAVQVNAHQRLIARRTRSKRVHLAKLRQHAHGAERGNGSNGITQKFSSGSDHDGYSSLWLMPVSCSGSLSASPKPIISGTHIPNGLA